MYFRQFKHSNLPTILEIKLLLLFIFILSSSVWSATFSFFLLLFLLHFPFHFVVFINCYIPSSEEKEEQNCVHHRQKHNHLYWDRKKKQVTSIVIIHFIYSIYLPSHAFFYCANIMLPSVKRYSTKRYWFYVFQTTNTSCFFADSSS